MTQKVATADVSVRVTSRVVVNVEQPMIQVLVVITTRMQTRVTRIEIPVIVFGLHGTESWHSTAVPEAPRSHCVT